MSYTFVNVAAITEIKNSYIKKVNLVTKKNII